MLYQLGRYNTKQDLGEQTKRIRNHLLLHQDFNSILKLINEYDNLELESILILKKAINAGYWNSIYGFNWNKDEEVLFWKTVYDKSRNKTISKLQYLRILQTSKNKKVEELKSDYIQILKDQPSLYYEFISEDLSKMWKIDNEIKIDCLNAMFIHLSDDMSLSEFEEEVEFQIQKHYHNTDVPKEIKETINRILIEKAGNYM